MDLGIKGRSALVVGGGGGLGGAIARTLAAEGARVAVAALHEDSAEAVASEIRGDGGDAFGFALDTGDLTSFEDRLSTVRERHGDVEILVNLTGGPPPTPAAGVDPAIWSEHFRAMVLGVIHLTDLVLPSMRSRRWGRVITSTSSGVVAPIPNLGLSNTLRASLVGWSKTLAGEVGPDGVTVNVVLPGRIATRRITRLDEARAEREGTTAEQVAAASTASIPLRRYGAPEEYGTAVAFLASTAASYITGATLRVDGGLIPSI
ncbi:SDR family oxidoreductase [Nonomuraea sp. M3C6]|uniref:SDR family oxidoreductase n=1 Tax=Nonomuraea marmarensis TaxID=3351344 RepID=A0ABW7AVE4_9ACTN